MGYLLLAEQTIERMESLPTVFCGIAQKTLQRIAESFLAETIEMAYALGKLLRRGIGAHDAVLPEEVSPALDAYRAPLSSIAEADVVVVLGDVPVEERAPIVELWIKAARRNGAEVLYRLGVCRYKLSAVDAALASFTEALALAEGSGYPCDRLRAHVFEWRSRCWRRKRDLEAAREDIEHALELAAGLGDELTVAHVTFQASIVAERGGNWRRARALAEQARVIYETHDDHVNVGRLRNNLGGLEFLLERPEQAVEHLKNAFAIALEHGSDGDAGQAESSLAQMRTSMAKACP